LLILYESKVINMFNMNNKKTRKIVSSVIILVVVLTMILTMVVPYLL